MTRHAGFIPAAAYKPSTAVASPTAQHAFGRIFKKKGKKVEEAEVVADSSETSAVLDAAEVDEMLQEEAENFANTIAAKVESLEKEPKKDETTKEEAAKVEEKTEATATKEEPKKDE